MTVTDKVALTLNSLGPDPLQRGGAKVNPWLAIGQQLAFPLAIGAYLAHRFILKRKSKTQTGQTSSDSAPAEANSRQAISRSKPRRSYKVKRALDGDDEAALAAERAAARQQLLATLAQANGVQQDVVDLEEDEDEEAEGQAGAGGGNNAQFLQMLQSLGYKVVMPQDGSGKVYLMPPGAEGPQAAEAPEGTAAAQHTQTTQQSAPTPAQHQPTSFVLHPPNTVHPTEGATAAASTTDTQSASTAPHHTLLEPQHSSSHQDQLTAQATQQGYLGAGDFDDFDYDDDDYDEYSTDDGEADLPGAYTAGPGVGNPAAGTATAAPGDRPRGRYLGPWEPREVADRAPLDDLGFDPDFDEDFDLDFDDDAFDFGEGGEGGYLGGAGYGPGGYMGQGGDPMGSDLMDEMMDQMMNEMMSEMMMGAGPPGFDDWVPPRRPPRTAGMEVYPIEGGDLIEEGDEEGYDEDEDIEEIEEDQ